MQSVTFGIKVHADEAMKMPSFLPSFSFSFDGRAAASASASALATECRRRRINWIRTLPASLEAFTTSASCFDLDPMQQSLIDPATSCRWLDHLLLLLLKELF